MKKALVTGGAGGIGQAVCRKLAQDGYFVYVNYSKSREKAEKLAGEICGEAVGFDLLVNNAGISEINLFDKVSDERVNEILGINLMGTLNCSRVFLPEMIRKKSGCIINISSMWGQCGASCEVDYSASKAGVIGFTKALAKETAPSGIRVNCVAPGFIMTEMNRNFSDEDLRLILEDILLGIFGKPEHIANAVSFLASEKAEYITGQILAVNGGMVI